MNMNMTSKLLIYSAAASTLIAGVLHLALVPMFLGQMTPEVTVFFVASGLAQIFWILPTVKIWIIYIPGGGHPIDLSSAVIEAFQIAFVILSIIIIKKSREESIKSGM